MGGESEAVLAGLCQRSFLSLWSYPNPYNDKGLAQRQEGKELCDLLVIFGDDVIIFSDKSCAYSNTGDEELDWKRWYRHAVQRSIDQIMGAERWLKQHPDRVFANNRCSTRLDVSIPSAEAIRVHRIVVALGARQRCYEYFGGGSGSLPISGGGPEPHQGDGRQLFSLGDEGRPHGFVHVFDDVGLNVVLRELDTVADFVKYLRRKEELFDQHVVIATGEEDLLAHYLLTMVDGQHGFLPQAPQGDPGGPVRCLFVDESAYPTLRHLPQYRASKTANEPSYVWDHLIEHFVRYYRAGHLVEGVSPSQFESALRVMASPDRVSRRQLGRITATAVQTTPSGRTRYTSVLNTLGDGTAIGVVCMSHREDVSYNVYRQRRQLLMELYARSLRVRSDAVRQVLVVGVQPRCDTGSSEDLALIDLGDWSADMDAETRRDMQLFGLGAPPQHFTEHEFPLTAPRPGTQVAEQRRKQAERLRKKEKQRRKQKRKANKRGH